MTNEDADPKQVVARGYDRIAERYAAWAGQVRVEERERYTRVLLDSVPAGAPVLELGCGTGLPTTKRLAERFAVTAVDLSERHVELARGNVPAAMVVHGDMTALDIPEAGFAAVAAFYSITHVPREEHARLLERIVRWLQPGGLLVAALGARASAGAVEADWLGAPMYFSHYGATTNKRLVRDAGLRVLSAHVEPTDEDGVPVPFLWVVAEKPGANDAQGV